MSESAAGQAAQVFIGATKAGRTPRDHVLRLRVRYARDCYATVRKVTNGKVIR